MASRIQREIEQRVLQLRRVDQRREGIAGDGGLQLDRFAEGPAQQFGEARDELPDIRELRIERLPAPEGEELPGKLGAVVGRALGLAQQLPQVVVIEAALDHL